MFGWAPASDSSEPVDVAPVRLYRRGTLGPVPESAEPRAGRDVVEAAGGVVARERADGSREYAIIHRPKYDDWSLPKGKLDPGETDDRAAIREVEEETGMLCRLGPDLGSVAYVDTSGRDKTVRYWLMVPLRGRFHATREVDDLRWLPVVDALALISYDRDRAILRAADSRDSEG